MPSTFDKLLGEQLLHKHKAVDVEVVDAEGLYAATDVEGALKEVAENNEITKRYAFMLGGF